MNVVDRHERPIEGPRVLKEKIGIEALGRVSFPYIHNATENAWDGNDVSNIARIFIAGLEHPRFRNTIGSKLLDTGHPETDVRWERIGQVYSKAFEEADELPQETRERLAGSVSALPLDEMPLSTAILILGSMQKTCSDVAPDMEFKFDPLEALKKPLDSNAEEDHAYFGNVIRAKKYFNGEEATDVIVSRIADWADQPTGGRRILMSLAGENIYAADVFIPDVIDALSGNTEQQLSFTQQLIDRNVPVDFISQYIKDGFFNERTDAEPLFQQLSLQRPELVIVYDDQLKLARGRFFAKKGDVEKAEEIARGADYSDYSFIMMQVARTQFNADDRDRALSTLDTIVSKNPVEDFAGVEDVEGHILYMGGSPRGFILEHVAETYLEFGAIPQAVTAYDKSRQYPMQTEVKMGEMAVEQDITSEYIRHLANDKSINYRTRSNLAIECLRKAVTKLGSADRTAVDLVELQNLIEPLIEEGKNRLLVDQDSLSRELDGSSIASMYIWSGRIAEGLEVIDIIDNKYKKGVIVGEAVASTAMLGSAAESWTLYSQHPSTPIEDKVNPLRHVLAKALLQEDYATAQNVIDVIPDYKIGDTLFRILREHGDDIVAVPSVIEELFLTSPYEVDNRGSTKDSLRRYARCV